MKRTAGLIALGQIVGDVHQGGTQRAVRAADPTSATERRVSHASRFASAPAVCEWSLGQGTAAAPQSNLTRWEDLPSGDSNSAAAWCELPHNCESPVRRDLSQMHQAGIADLSVSQRQNSQVGQRRQIRETIVGDLRVRQVQHVKVGQPSQVQQVSGLDGRSRQFEFGERREFADDSQIGVRQFRVSEIDLGDLDRLVLAKKSVAPGNAICCVRNVAPTFVSSARACR